MRPEWRRVGVKVDWFSWVQFWTCKLGVWVGKYPAPFTRVALKLIAQYVANTMRCGFLSFLGPTLWLFGLAPKYILLSSHLTQTLSYSVYSLKLCPYLSPYYLPSTKYFLKYYELLRHNFDLLRCLEIWAYVNLRW